MPEKTIDQASRFTQDEWQTTFDVVQDIVTIQDSHTRIVRANKAAHKLLGFGYGELVGMTCCEAFKGQVENCDDCPAYLTCRNNEVCTGVVYNSRFAKTYRVTTAPLLDEQGKMEFLVHVARDITTNLQNESEKNLLTAAIEQAWESVVITDEAGTVQYVNPAFEVSTGYSRYEVVGSNMRLLKSGMHGQKFYQNMWKTLMDKQVWRGRLTNKIKNGTLLKEDVTISPVINSEGQITNFVALKRDVTKEESLERQLQLAIRMEALGTLAGGIAHDFNNILSAMIGYGEIAKGKLEPGHPVKKDLEQVLAGGDRAVDLVKQILTFSRQEGQAQFRPLKVQYIIKEVIKLLRPSLPATIKLKHKIDNSCGSIMADAGQIYQVVMNLCTNARQSIGDSHGEINIMLSEIRPKETLSSVGHEEYVPGSYLDLEVSDTGVGIKEKDLGKIFDPFFTSKAKEHGTGLGLAVVHGIIKKHKGGIQVTSKVGEGSTFHVYLAVEGAEINHQVEMSVPEFSGNERVMIVEDEIGVGEVHQRMLQGLGYKVTVFNDSIAAVKHYRKNPNCCDLVLTDMTMPNMTGAELAREFLAQRADLPIIMVTGHSANMDSKRARRIGIKALLDKPVKKQTLHRVIRRVLSDGKDSDN